MPIPGLATKTSSPQDWKKNSFKTYRLPRSHYSGRKPKMPKNIFKAGLTLVVLGIAFFGLGSLILLAWAAKDLPNPNRIIERNIALSTKIYDRTGEILLYDIHGAEKRTFVKLEEIPEYLQEATLTAEDRKFYEHKGISITGILRSVLKNITTGSKVGGSTLTQQLVKNAILSPEKKYTRKIKEIILSYQIEKKFSKDEILQMYFNEIPYGSVAYGAEAAAQTYFGKSVKDLDLAQAAILAALPQAPTYYSPYGSHTDKLFARQQYILDSMAELGYINQDQAEEAKKEKIEFKKSNETIIAPHFVMYVKEYLTNRYDELTVEQGGLKVITTLDVAKQKMAEEAIAAVTEQNAKKYNANNAALVSLDVKTGQILALVGSKDYFADPFPKDCKPGVNCSFDPQVNIALRPRQPGSSFKPIVYAASFIKGYTPQTILYDVNTNFLNSDGRDYNPKNYDLKERGPVTIRQALAGSLNIPAVKAIYLTGVDNVINLAQELGYTTLDDRSRFGLALVLGGGEVKLIEHLNAFATFAREGEWQPVTGILEVRDKDGNLLEEYKKQDKKILATQVARQINNILSDNGARAFIFGEENYLTLPGRPVAAKTGTTNDYHDAWTMGFTPSIATGVWVGNSDNSEMKRGADGSIVAAPIWNKYMKQALADTPTENFTEPEPTQSDKPVLNGSLAEGGLKVKIDKISGKLATEFTPPDSIEEKIYHQAHSILYYINKDDPAGNTPPDWTDPQYLRWEEAVQVWAQKNNIISENPPTESDDIHTPQNQPQIQIISPRANETITNRQLSAQVNAFAPRGVARVEYFLNDQKIKTVLENPFALNVILNDPALTSGFYQLKAVAYDDVNNSNSDAIELNLQLPSLPAVFNWLTPNDNGKISQNKFPYQIKASLNEADNSQIKFYYQGANGQANYIGQSQPASNGQITAYWLPAPEPGSYQLYAEIKNSDGYTYQSKKINIIIE
jgi:1A family penicillin-binding protein